MSLTAKSALPHRAVLIHLPPESTTLATDATPPTALSEQPRSYHPPHLKSETGRFSRAPRKNRHMPPFPLKKPGPRQLATPPLLYIHPSPPTVTVEQSITTHLRVHAESGTAIAELLHRYEDTHRPAHTLRIKKLAHVRQTSSSISGNPSSTLRGMRAAVDAQDKPRGRESLWKGFVGVSFPFQSHLFSIYRIHSFQLLLPIPREDVSCC